MELKKLIKNTSYLAGTKVVQFFTGIISAKINAVLLGTVGIGVVKQLDFMSRQMANFTRLSMSEAVVKQIAENKDDNEIRDLASASLKSYIVLVLSFMLISIVLFIIFSQKLTVYVLGDIKYLKYFYIGLFSFPILIMNSIPFAILMAFKDVKSISIARIGVIIVNLIIFIPLVLLFRLKGAVIYIPLSYIITLLFNYLIVYKKHLLRMNIGLKTIFTAQIKKKFVKELFLFSGFGLVVGSYTIVSEFICRSIVVSQLGVEAIGLYNPIIAWSGLFIGFILPSFSTYLFPRFAETKSNYEVTGIINDAIRLSTFLLIPFLFLAIPYRDILIKVFYSAQFVGAAQYLPYHFIGTIFYVWVYVFMQSMTPKGKIKQHALFYLLFLTLNIIVTYFTVPIWGLGGWMLKHIISPVIFFFVYFVYINRKLDFRFDKSNILIMLYLFLGSVILALSVTWNKILYFTYILGPVFMIFSWFLLKYDERKFVLDKVLSVKAKYLGK